MNTFETILSRVRCVSAAVLAAALALGCVAALSGCDVFREKEGVVIDDATPMGTTHDFVITGGVEGADYAYQDVNYKRAAHTGGNKAGNEATPMLVILSDKPMTISNADGVAMAGTGIRIAAGVDAHLTFDGVKITADVPCDIVTNSAKPGTADKTLAGNSTKLHLTLADGSDNQLLANAGAHAPGLRCGEGSELYIDDAVSNVDTSGNPITPANGFIPAGTEYVAQDGKTYTASGSGADSSLSNLESRNPGKLMVQAGYRAAGIGSGSWENAGKMTFNGGDFVVRPWAQKNTKRETDCRYEGGAVVNANWDMGCGAGIGGGYAGCGTEMYFNGGTFDVHGSYHGAAIGGGMYAHNTGTSPGDWPARSYPFADAIRSGLVPNNGNTPATAKTTPGDITINGGFIKAKGGLHGNAFGQACGSWAKGCTIMITGGTLLPDSYDKLKMIGGAEGHVVVTGGSVNCAKDKFEGIGNTAWGSTDYSNANNKVFMTTIDLSADGWVNHTITNFGLTINGEEQNYGAPSKFDNGKLYLWLPSTAVGKEVRVSLTGEKVAGDGTVTQETPADLYIPSVSTDGSSKLKRYISFQLPEEWRQSHWYKDYNGLPFEGYDFENNGAILTKEDPPKELNTSKGVSYKYQYCDDEGNPQGEEVTVDAAHPMPTDASKFTITMTSEQYSGQAGFKESYWGHRAYGDAEIRKVASRIPTLKAQWYDAAGKLIDDENHKAKATDRLLITAQITSGENTATTCKAPTGIIELMVDGNVVETFDISKAGGTVETGKVEVLSYADGREYIQFTYEARAADKDYLLPTFKDDNKHEVTMNYKAAKNYLDCMADEDPNVPKANVTVEPVDPDPGVTPGADLTVDPTAPDNPDDPDGPNGPTLSDDGTTYQKEFGLTYTFKKLPAGETANKLTFEISSPSSGAFDVKQPADEAVASGVSVKQKTDADGNPVKDAAGNYVYEVTVDVTSVGEAAFELTQKPNGAFYGTNFIIDLTVKPNPGIDPVPTLTKTAVNLTHPQGAVQAGDRIKYTITATNTAAGSIWWFPKITDPLPESVTLDTSTLHLVSHSEGIDKMLKKGEYTLSRGTLTVGAGVLTKVYGPQSAVLEFECVVKDEVGERDADADLLSVANEASGTGYKGIDLPEGDEPDPKDPDDPNVPDDEKPNATPVIPAPTGPVEPENPKVLPKDPHLADMAIDKQAQNLNRVSGASQVGDVVQYTVTMTNGTPGSCWYRAAFVDALPKGVVFEPGSAELVTPTGDRLKLDDAIYDAATNRLGVAIGDIYGGEKAVLSFRAVVTEAAVGQDLGNISHAVGTLPSQKDKPKPGGNTPENPDDPDDPNGGGNGGGGDPTDPDNPDGPTSPIDPSNPGGGTGIPEVPGEPGMPYLPDDDVLIDVITQGGLPIDPDNPEGPKSTPQNPEPAYPTPDDKPVTDDGSGGAVADPDDAAAGAAGNLNGGGSGSDDDSVLGKVKEAGTRILRLAQTGDETTIAALTAVAGIALLAVALVYVKLRNRREDD